MKENFCCEEMQQHIREEEVAVAYEPSARRFSIKVLSDDSTQQIYYCPWCGTKLPTDLRNQLSHIIFEELQLEWFDDPRLPEEFKSDEWWKKRGL